MASHLEKAIGKVTEIKGKVTKSGKPLEKTIGKVMEIKGKSYEKWQAILKKTIGKMTEIKEKVTEYGNYCSLAVTGVSAVACMWKVMDYVVNSEEVFSDSLPTTLLM